MNKKLSTAILISAIFTLVLGFGIFYATAQISSCPDSIDICADLTLAPSAKQELLNALSDFSEKYTPESAPATLGKKSMFETMNVAPDNNDSFYTLFKSDGLTIENNANTPATFSNTGTRNGLEIVGDLQGTATSGIGMSATGKTLGLYSFGNNIGLTANGQVVGTTTGDFGVKGQIESGAWGALGANPNDKTPYGIYTANDAWSNFLNVTEDSWLSGKLIGTNLMEPDETQNSFSSFINSPTVQDIISSFIFFESLDISGDVTIEQDLTLKDGLGAITGGLEVGGAISASQGGMSWPKVNFSNSATVKGNTRVDQSVTADDGIGKFYTVISDSASGKVSVSCENKSNQSVVSCGASVANENEYAGAQKMSPINGVPQPGCTAYAQSSNQPIQAIAYCFDPYGTATSSGSIQ